MKFEEFTIHDGTLDAIVAMGYETPTPIQAQAIPPMLKGRDVVGQARTGTGKTAAFGIPMVDALRHEHSGTVGLVLLPTRELALQVAEVLTDLAKASALQIVSVYGGVGFGKQLSDLDKKGPKIIVACPGRLLDLIERGAANLSQVKVWVLDEADRMLDMGFVRDMRKIEKMVARNRQTALFSATFPAEVQKLVKEFTNDAVHISVDDGEATVPQAEQFYARVEKSLKTSALLHLLHEEQPVRAVVFTRTKHLAKRLAIKLVSKGWASVALQGNMTQGQRERAMTAFRDGGARLLVATDVAARGLDVQGVTHVINFDLPDQDAYVHRVGRTARNGAAGRAFTFVQSDEAQDFKSIQRHIGKQVDAIQVNMDESAAPDGPDPKVAPAQPVVNQHNNGGANGGNNPNGAPRRRRYQPSGSERGVQHRRSHGGGGNQGGQRSGNRTQRRA